MTAHKATFKSARWLLGIVVIAITICGVRATTCHAQEKLILKGDFSAAKAMELIYGNFSAEKRVSTWKPGIVCNRTTYGAIDLGSRVGKEDFEARIASLTGFHANGSDKYYMLTGTRWDTCHACQPILGVFLWKKQKQGWLLEKSDKCFGVFGSYGNLPHKIYPVQILRDKFGMMLEETYTSTGESTLHYLLITDWGNRFKVVLDGLGANSYDGGCDDSPPSPLCHSFSSNIYFSADRGSVQVYYSGTYPRKTRKGTRSTILNWDVMCNYDAARGTYVKSGSQKSKCLGNLPFQKSIE